MKSLIVIPSRIGSTRLPKKPLIDLCGKTLIQRVYEGARESKLANKIIIATDSLEIKKKCEEFNAQVMMTPQTINTGSDRVAYVAEKLQEEFDIIVNVQGDEPFCTGEMVDSLISSLKHNLDNPNCVMSTLKVKFKNSDDILNPNLVKVITDNHNNAIYFSRSVIPYNRDKTESFTHFRHLGYYAYKTDFLITYSSMKQTPLEKMESLEQLRVLENGFNIKVVETENDTLEINTFEDIELFEKKFNSMNN